MSEGRKFGYARVSTDDQDNAIQEVALLAAGCACVFAEKMTGTKLNGRVQLDALLKAVRKGDTIVVVRIDRLARNTRDLLNLVHDLTDKGVALRALTQDIDTSGLMGKLMLTVLAMVAEFETGLRKERQMAGIAKAKAAGVYKGRPFEVDAAKVRELKASGKGVSAIARELGASRPSVYRALNAVVDEPRRMAKTRKPNKAA